MIVGRKLDSVTGTELILHSGLRDEGVKVRKLLPKGSRLELRPSSAAGLTEYSHVTAGGVTPYIQAQNVAVPTRDPYSRPSAKPVQKPVVEAATKNKSYVMSRDRNLSSAANSTGSVPLKTVSDRTTDRTVNAAKWLKEEQEKAVINSRELQSRKAKAQEVEEVIQNRRVEEEKKRAERDLQLLMASSFEDLFRDGLTPNADVPQPMAAPVHPLASQSVAVNENRPVRNVIEPNKAVLSLKASQLEPPSERMPRKAKTDSGVFARSETVSSSKPTRSAQPFTSKSKSEEIIPEPGVPIVRRAKQSSGADDDDDFVFDMESTKPKPSAAQRYGKSSDDNYEDEDFEGENLGNVAGSQASRLPSRNNDETDDDASGDRKKVPNLIEEQMQEEKNRRRSEGKKFKQEKLKKQKEALAAEQMQKEKLAAERAAKLKQVREESRQLATAKLPETARNRLANERVAKPETENIPVYGELHCCVQSNVHCNIFNVFQTMMTGLWWVMSLRRFR
jgi:hypothetical protein